MDVKHSSPADYSTPVLKTLELLSRIWQLILTLIMLGKANQATGGQLSIALKPFYTARPELEL